MTMRENRSVTVDEKTVLPSSSPMVIEAPTDLAEFLAQRRLCINQAEAHGGNWRMRYYLKRRLTGSSSHYRTGNLAAKDFFYIIQEDITNATYAPSLH